MKRARRDHPGAERVVSLPASRPPSGSRAGRVSSRHLLDPAEQVVIEGRATDGSRRMVQLRITLASKRIAGGGSRRNVEGRLSGILSRGGAAAPEASSVIVQPRGQAVSGRRRRGHVASNRGSGGSVDRVVRVREVVHADAEQPHRPYAGVGLLEQGDRANGNRVRVACRHRDRVAARDRREIVVAHLDGDRPAGRAPSAPATPHRRAPSDRSRHGSPRGSVRSCEKVFSVPHDFAARLATTGRSSMPSASRRSQST